MRARPHAIFLALAILSGTSHAAADVAADARVAEGLFEEARLLMEQKRFAEACPKLATSQKLDPGGGTLLNLAVCHAAEGKLATALVEYHDALAQATRDGRGDREKIARASIESLERDVPRLTVRVPQPTADLEVTVDQTMLPRGAWGTPMPVDPGPHVVVAATSNGVSSTVHIDMAVGERKTVDANLPTPPPVGGPPPRIQPSSTPGASTSTQTNPLFWVVLGTTLGASGVALGAGAFAILQKSKSDDGCIAERSWCRDTASSDAHENARTFAWVSTGALVVAAVGTVLLVITPFHVRSNTTTATSHVGPRWNGLGGTF